MKPLTVSTTATIADEAAISEPIDVRYAKYGSYLVPALDGTVLTFTACETIDGTYAAIHNASASVYTVTYVEGKWHTFPAGVIQGNSFIRIVTTTTQTTAAATFTIQLQRDES